MTTLNGKELTVSLKNELTVSSPELVAGASLLKMTPQTLLRKVNRYLPNPVEARFYLEIGPPLKHHPRVFSDILREVMGNDELGVGDFNDPLFNGAKLDFIIKHIEDVASLIIRASNDYNILWISGLTASRLVLVYGDNADSFIASIMDNIHDIAILLKGESVHSYKEERIAKAAFGMWCHKFYPLYNKYGRVHHVEFLEYFQADYEFMGLDLESQEESPGYEHEKKFRENHYNGYYD